MLGLGARPEFSGLNLERTQCQADSDVVAGDFNTGTVRLTTRPTTPHAGRGALRPRVFQKL